MNRDQAKAAVGLRKLFLRDDDLLEVTTQENDLAYQLD